MESSALPKSILEFKQITEDLSNLQSNLDSYLKDIQRQVIEKKHDYSQSMADLLEEEKRLANLIKQQKTTEKNYWDIVNKDLQKRDATLDKLKKLKSERDEYLSQKRDMEDEIRRVNEEYENKSRDFHDKKTFIKDQLVVNTEKVLLFERLLGMRIDVESPETLKITFKNIDPDDFTRTVSFTYNTTQEAVTETEPELNAETINSIKDNYLKQKNIGYFWRDMRANLRKKLVEGSD